MLAPEKMKFLRLWVLEKDIEEVTKKLCSTGMFHIVEEYGASSVYSYNEEVLSKIENLLTRARMITDRLNLKIKRYSEDFIKESLNTSMDEFCNSAISMLISLEQEINSLLVRKENLHSRIYELDEIAEVLYLFLDHGIDLSLLKEVEKFFITVGIIEKTALEIFKSNIKDISYHILTRQKGKHSRFITILLIGDRAKSDEISRALEKAKFRYCSFLEGFLKEDKSLDVLIMEVEMKLWESRDDLIQVEEEIVRFKERHENDISNLIAALKIYLGIQQKLQKFPKISDNVYVISGFVPESDYKTFMNIMSQKTSDIALFIETVEEVPLQIRPPTKLINPLIFRPFENLLKIYGLPVYDEIDPTPLLAIFFVVMFGMTFGDVGHGLCLFVCGLIMLLLNRKFEFVMGWLAHVLIHTGISSMFFGFLFGSIFGIENDKILPALWMRPSEPENLHKYLIFSVSIGVVVISVGIILNILKYIRKRNLLQAVVTQWGICTLVFYWLSLFMVVRWLMKKEVLPWGIIITVLSIPIVMIILGQILIHTLVSQKVNGNHKEEDLGNVFLEIFEAITGLFTNTVSFVRLAAFGMVHIGLDLTVSILSSLMSQTGLNWIFLPFEHIFIILLEGLIVSIQCLRLEYYEFFSKFFVGDGIEYKPLRYIDLISK